MASLNTRQSATASPILAIGFVFAFIAPGLLSAWTVNATLVISMMMIPSLVALIVVAVQWPPRGISLHGPVFLLMIALLLYLPFELYMTEAHADPSIREIAGNAFGYFGLSLIQLVPLGIAASASRVRPPVTMFVQSLYVAAVVVSALQIFLVAIGVTNPKASELAQAGTGALLLQTLGFSSSRIVMPLSAGFQAGAIAPLVAALIAMTKLGRGKSFRHLAAFVIGLVPLLMLDVRQFAIALAFVPLVRRLARTNAMIAIGGAFFPFTYPLVVLIAGKLPFLAEIVSARGDRFGMFSGREFIWTQFAYYLHSATPKQVLLGNGIYGQAVSDLSLHYAFMFNLWSASTKRYMLLHNSYFQTMADGGLVGLAIWMLLIGLSIYRAQALANTGDAETRKSWALVSAMLLALVFVATSETDMTIYLKEAIPVWFSMFMLIAFFGGRRTASLPVAASDAPSDSEPFPPRARQL